MTFTLWKYRRFILANSLNDLRHRFSGSVAGYLWNVFTPLAQLLVYALIFGVLMGDKVAEGPQIKFSFIIYLCSGLLAWNSFAETLIRSSAALVGNAGYIKKLPLPEQIFVAQEATSGFVTAAISIVIFVLFSILVARYGPFWQWLAAIPVLALLISFAYGFGLMLACFNVFFRDVQPFMNVMVLLWMWLTPVVYLESIFHNAAGSHWLILKIFHLNPAYHYINALHQSLWLGQAVPIGDWMSMFIITGVSVALGTLVLRQTRGELRDVL